MTFPQPDPPIEKAREMKHCVILSALEGLALQVGKIENFVGEVRGESGEKQQPGVTGPSSLPSLANFLEEGPNIVNGCTDRLAQCLKALKESLF